tara:strand:- start:103 stop:306 length:204 start_codon:yes stop_codon:yes gene_type:complete
METNIEKRINELEARNAFQEDSIERLSSEVRKQQQEITILKEKLHSVLDALKANSEIENSNEKPPHY